MICKLYKSLIILALLVLMGYMPQAQTMTTIAGGINKVGDGGPATSASLYSYFTAIDVAGNLYTADYDNHRIRKVDAATGIITTVAGNGTAGFSGDGGLAINAQLNFPTSVGVDGSGNIYIAEPNSSRIRKVNALTGIITTIAGTGISGFSGDGGAATDAQLDGFINITVDAAGNVYVPSFDSRVRKIDATTGIIVTIAGNGIFSSDGDNGSATSASLGFPFDLAVDASGNLYIAELSYGKIRKVASGTGIITTVAGGGNNNSDGILAINASLGSAYSVSLDGYGNIYIAENESRVRKVDASTGIITTVAGTGTKGFSGDNGIATSARVAPYGIESDNAGNLYLSEISNARIRKVSATTGIITTFAGNGTRGYSGDGGLALNANLSYPSGVAVDSDGNVYFSDSGNHSVRMINTAGVITTVAGSGIGGFAGD